MGVMTAKRDGTISLLLLTMACCAVLGYYFLGDWRRGTGAVPKPLPALPDIQVPVDTDLAKMDTLRKGLNRLAYPRAADRTRTQLSLFGYTPAATGLRQGRGMASGATPPPVQFDYVLSFALSAGRQQLCMLDGQLFVKGAILPDGGRIVSIEPERVLIEKTPLQRWIYLQERQTGRVAPNEARVPGQTSQGEG